MKFEHYFNGREARYRDNPVCQEVWYNGIQNESIVQIGKVLSGYYV